MNGEDTMLVQFIVIRQNPRKYLTFRNSSGYEVTSNQTSYAIFVPASKGVDLARRVWRAIERQTSPVARGSYALPFPPTLTIIH